jgi:hypothetical protein
LFSPVVTELELSSSMLQARSLEVEHRLAKTVRTPAP